MDKTKLQHARHVVFQCTQTLDNYVQRECADLDLCTALLAVKFALEAVLALLDSEFDGADGITPVYGRG